MLDRKRPFESTQGQIMAGVDAFQHSGKLIAAFRLENNFMTRPTIGSTYHNFNSPWTSPLDEVHHFSSRNSLHPSCYTRCNVDRTGLG